MTESEMEAGRKESRDGSRLTDIWLSAPCYKNPRSATGCYCSGLV